MKFVLLWVPGFKSWRGGKHAKLGCAKHLKLPKVYGWVWDDFRNPS